MFIPIYSEVSRISVARGICCILKALHALKIITQNEYKGILGEGWLTLLKIVVCDVCYTEHSIKHSRQSKESRKELEEAEWEVNNAGGVRCPKCSKKIKGV